MTGPAEIEQFVAELGRDLSARVAEELPRAIRRAKYGRLQLQTTIYIRSGKIDGWDITQGSTDSFKPK